MQSAMRSARSDLWLCSPKTHEIASTTLDLPHPLGPTMQVVPVPLKVTTVRSQNDLNPIISTFLSFSKLSPLSRSPRLHGKQHCSGRKTRRGTTMYDSREGVSSDNSTRFGRPTKRLAGSRSEAQPPGARMAVPEKNSSMTLYRCKAHAKSGGGNRQHYNLTPRCIGSTEMQSPCRATKDLPAPAIKRLPVVRWSSGWSRCMADPKVTLQRFTQRKEESSNLLGAPVPLIVPPSCPKLAT